MMRHVVGARGLGTARITRSHETEGGGGAGDVFVVDEKIKKASGVWFCLSPFCPLPKINLSSKQSCSPLKETPSSSARLFPVAWVCGLWPLTFHPPRPSYFCPLQNKKQLGSSDYSVNLAKDNLEHHVLTAVNCISAKFVCSFCFVFLILLFSLSLLQLSSQVTYDKGKTHCWPFGCITIIHWRLLRNVNKTLVRSLICEQDSLLSYVEGFSTAMVKNEVFCSCFDLETPSGQSYISYCVYLGPWMNEELFLVSHTRTPCGQSLFMVYLFAFNIQSTVFVTCPDITLLINLAL